MSTRLWERALYESGLWLTTVPLAAWWELRKRHRLEDQGLSLEEAELARLVTEQRRASLSGERQEPQRLGGRYTVSLDATARAGGSSTLGQVLGVSST